MTYEMASSWTYKDKAVYAQFCQELSTRISKRYFNEVFLDSFMYIMEEKSIIPNANMQVQIAVLSSVKNIRLKVEDV